MGYGYKSPVYNIPAVTFGALIDDAEEQRAAQTIDTQIQGAITAHSGGSGVIEEGIATGTYASNNSSVTLVESKPLAALKAFINRIYTVTASPLSWTGLTDNATHYLYVRLVETSSASSRQFGNMVTSSNTTGVTPGDGLLVFTATTTAVDITIDTNPTGKITLFTVASHIADNTDPHGSTLYQTTLVSSGIEVRGTVTAEDLIVNNNFTTNQRNPFHCLPFNYVKQIFFINRTRHNQ